MRIIFLNHQKMLLTMIVILTILLIGCAAKQIPEVRITPRAKAQIPPDPDKHLKPIDGTIGLRNGEKIIKPDNTVHLTVPKEGGVYYPKNAAKNLEYNDRIWQYYKEGVKKLNSEYNADIEKENQEILKPEEENKKKKWWFW